MTEQFDRRRLLELFSALSDELERRRTIGVVHVAGGAAMMLAYGADLATGDADALFEPDGPMVEAIHAVADEAGVPRSWMNNQASSYFSNRVRPVEVVFETAWLRVLVTPPDHLLAMKVLAARATRDRDDALLLVEHLGLVQESEVTEIVGRFFPEEPLGPRQQAFIKSLGLAP